MAIVPVNAPFLFLEGKRIPYTGRILQLGRQAIFFNREELPRAAQPCDFRLKPAEQHPLVPYQFGPEKLVLSDVEFFQWLGFNTVDSLDFNALEDNNIIFDLNSEQTPEELTESYDVILDPGTIEHVFHVPNFLKNIHRMLKVGGRIMHFAPASNQIEHGFYSFSPCFFIDYYAKNGYDLVSVKLIKLDPHKSEFQAWVLDLFPGHVGLRTALSRLGGLDGSTYTLFTIAHKLPTSSCGVIPIQGHYEQRMKSCGKDSTKEHVTYPWENGKWVLPWVGVPCFIP
jgi:hypothetical protein